MKKLDVDKLQKEMKEMWCVNKLVMETQFAKEVKVHNKIIIKKIIKTKLVGTKGKFWEFKLVVQTLEHHITKVETKFDEKLN